MDRRTVLAFILIFLVIIGWDLLYRSAFRQAGPETAPGDASTTPERVEPVPDEQLSDRSDQAEIAALEERTDTQDNDLQVASSESRTSYAPPVEALEFLSTTSTQRELKVRTPLYEIVVDLVGARITSWRGLAFPGPSGGAVQLIPPEEERSLAGGDQIVFRNREIDLGLIHYEAETPMQLDLGATDASGDVVLRAETAGGLTVRRIYTFFPGRYDFDLEIQVIVPEALQPTLGDPVRTRFSWVEGIASTERDKKLEVSSFRSFAQVGEVITTKKRLDLQRREKVRESFQGTVHFAGLQNKYFLIAGIVPEDPDQPLLGSILLDGDPERNQLNWAIEIPLLSIPAAEGQTTAAHLTYYLGPSDIDILKMYGHHLEQVIDLGPMGVFHPLARVVLTLMVWVYRWVPNYGLVIIIISVLTKVAFYPLTRTSTRSMKRMQELQPKIKALQEKYKDDRQKLGEATMKLYKEHKVNPMAGCLPLLVQSPVFIALFQALRNAIALRQAPFLLWIDDLSQPDALMQWPVNLPFLGNNLNVLPILMSLSMWLQTKLTPTTATGSQMAIMNTMLPIMMLVFFYNMPSGLVLYWLVNTVMTIYQTWRIHRTAPATGGAQTA